MTSESVSSNDKFGYGNGTSDVSSSLLCDMLEQSIKSHDTNEVLISKLQKNLKLWKLRYKRLLLNKSATKQVSNVKLKLKCFSGSLQCNNANRILQHLEIKYHKLQQTNGELACSLAYQREEAQRHYAASISHQHQLQALQEGIDEAVSSRLLEVLAEMSVPLIDRLNGSIEASRQQMEQLQVARSLAVALSSAAECGGAPPSTGVLLGGSPLIAGVLLGGTVLSSGNQSEQVTPSVMKVTDKRPSSPGVVLDPEGGALPFSPSGSSNRQCRVLPMVMGHVLQQPRLALPKMDPATLRAAAREWRETVRIESGMNMSIIAEREQEENSEVDESHISLANDNSDGEDNATLTSESPSLPAMNDSSLRALPSVRVDLSDCVVPPSESGGDARRGDAASSRPRGRLRSSRGGDRLSLVRAQVKEIVSAVSFGSSDSFTVSETSTHSDEQPSFVDRDPLEGPSWLYSPNSTVNVPRKTNSLSPKGCSRSDKSATTTAINKVAALARANTVNSDSDSDSLPDDERPVSCNFVSKPHDKEEVCDDDVSLPNISKVTRKVYRKKKGQEKNYRNILVMKSHIKCDAQKDDNTVGSLLPIPTLKENQSNSDGTTNRESTNSLNDSLKRKSQSNLSNVVDKKRRLSRRQSSRKSVPRDNTKPCEIRVPVQDPPRSTQSDGAISEEIDEEQSINRLTSPVRPRLTKSPDDGTSQQQTKVSQRSALSVNASSPYTNGTTSPPVDSPSARMGRETKYRSYGSVSPSSPNVMLRRFEELEKRGRRYTKSKGKSREKASSADTSADRLSITNDSDGNKRKKKGAGDADCSSLMLTSNTSDSSSVVTTDIQNCQGRSNKALVVANDENDDLVSCHSKNERSVFAVDNGPTSHDREDDMATSGKNIKNIHAKKQDPAMNANKEEQFTSNAIEDRDTAKVTTRKLSTQTNKSKQNAKSPLPGCSENIGSDLDSAQTANEEETTNNKAVDDQDTRKVTTRKLSTQTKKSKQNTGLPLPGCSDNVVDHDIDLQNGHEPDKTCHFNEAMEITFVDSSSVPDDSYSFNFFGSSKNKPAKELQKISNEEVRKGNVNLDEHTFEVPKLRGRRRKKRATVTTDICGKSVDTNTRNLKDKTEFDLSQLEATVLSIAPYKSSKLKENRPPQEGLETPPDSTVQQSESSTRRLSIVLVDVLKSSEPVESSPAITLPSLTNNKDLNDEKGSSFKEIGVALPNEESSERNPKPDQLISHSTNRKSRRVPAQSRRAPSSRTNRGASVDYNETPETSRPNYEQQKSANSDAPTTPVSSGKQAVSVDPEGDRSGGSITMLNGETPHNPYDTIIDLTLSPAPSVLSFSDDENSVSDCEIILPPICGEPKPDDFIEFIDVSKLNVSDSDLSNFSKPSEVIQNGSDKIAGSKQSTSLSKNHIPTADGNASLSVSAKKRLHDLPTKNKSRCVKLHGKRVAAASHSMTPPAATAGAEDSHNCDDSTESILRDASASSPRHGTAISEINSFVNDILQEEGVSADTCRSDEAPVCDAGANANTHDRDQVMDATKSDADAIAGLSDVESLVERVMDDRDSVTGRNVGLSDAGATEQDTQAVTNRLDGPAAAAAMEQDDEAAPSGGTRADGCGLGGGAPCHPRRATVKVVSYAEPKINRKLRRGDTIFPTIYAPDTGSKKKNNATRTAPAAKEN